MEGKKGNERIDWTYLFYFYFKKYCSMFVWNERKGNGRIDWSGSERLDLFILFLFLKNIAESSYGRKEKGMEG